MAGHFFDAFPPEASTQPDKMTRKCGGGVNINVMGYTWVYLGHGDRDGKVFNFKMDFQGPNSCWDGSEVEQLCITQPSYGPIVNVQCLPS